MYIYIYAHVDTLYTCYLFYYVFLSYYLFVEFGQSMVHIRSQLKTAVIKRFFDIYRGANDITNEAAETEEDWGDLGASQAYGPVNSHYGPFFLKKTHLSKIKNKISILSKANYFSFGQLSFSPLFLFIDVVYIYIRTRKYVYYIYKQNIQIRIVNTYMSMHLPNQEVPPTAKKVDSENPLRKNSRIAPSMACL